MFDEERMKTELKAPRIQRGPGKITGVLTGWIAGQLDGEHAMVDCADNPTGSLLMARSVVRWSEKDIGRAVMLMFERGCADRPVIMGFLQSNEDMAIPISAEVDSERILISADREIVLRCGDASITLTRAGKIILRGNYLLSRSTGANHIKGASVGIN